MERSGRALTCAGGHAYEESEGYHDLLPSRPAEREIRLFDGAWGWIYDRGIKNRTATPWLNRVWQGSSAGHLRKMYGLMDRGVTCGKEETVLDVPVGGGPALVGAAGRLRGRYAGVDLSRRQLRRAASMTATTRLGSRAVLVRADATAIPVADQAVDTVLTFNGLHLMPDKERVFRELHRILRPGGTIVGSTLVTDPSPTARLLHPWFFCPRIVPTVPAAEIERIARESGFEHWEQSRSGPLLVVRGRRDSAGAE